MDKETTGQAFGLPRVKERLQAASSTVEFAKQESQRCLMAIRFALGSAFEHFEQKLPATERALRGQLAMAGKRRVELEDKVAKLQRRIRRLTGKPEPKRKRRR